MKRHILSILLLFCTAASALAQEPRAAVEIRYVAEYGKYENDGKSWATPKRNIQDAINDLYSNNLQGEVWVAQGTYSPTESTESEGGSTLYMSFKVYPGITVRGGFYGLGTDENKFGTDDEGNVFVKLTPPTGAGGGYVPFELKTNGTTVQINDADTHYYGEELASDRMLQAETVAGTAVDTGYVYKTTLTGDLAQAAQFKWDDKRQQWETSFYGNCYHVVWFATNGFGSDGRANALNPARGNATVEGCVIRNGNARNTDLTVRSHTAYGGGAYMVKGSRLENCLVVNCEASRDGGGIYMDGGGVVKHCYIANCQALGIGVQNGYGGGVCLDTNYGSANMLGQESERMGIYRSSIVGNVGRLGGGMAIKYKEVPAISTTQIAPEYLAFASAVLVANNTATTEGGGIYTLHGGAMTNMTVVRNCCNGTGVTADGIVTGRAGGLYCRDHALVMNSVLWGNECEINNDVQYAASKSATAVKSVDMKFCAVSQSDYVDWSTTTNAHVRSIMNYNNANDYTGATANQAFPNFLQPSAQAGYYEGMDDGTRRNTAWLPAVNSCLANAGIVSHDLNTEGKYPFVDTPYDILNHPYTSHSTQGAYNRDYLIMRANKEGEEYHFYVDPNAPTNAVYTEHGTSWNSPARYLNNVLYCIANQKGNLTDGYENAKFVIHVKEGLVDNTDSYSSERVRNVAMQLSSNVTILGGYPAGLTGTEKKNDAKQLKRNPVKYPTVLTGDLMDDYELNASHMFILDGVSNVIIDGLQIRNVNARSRRLDNTDFTGAAMNMRNCTNITVRNTLVAGCTAERGAATIVRNSKGVKFENCIFHNNESRIIGAGELNNELWSAIEVRTDFNVAGEPAEYKVTFSHCNIMNNVGYAILLYNRGMVDISNSMLFGNTTSPRSKVYYTEDNADAVNGFRPYVAAGIPEMADAGQTFAGDLTNSGGFLYDEYTTIGAQPGTLRYLLNAPNAYPRFVNGVVNSGVTPAGDMTFYGRATSFMPHNENPMTNGAEYNATSTAASTDMSSVITRNYGGLPDVGAVENYASTFEDVSENAYPGGQPASGDVVYVRDYNEYEDALNANGDRVRVTADASTTHLDGTSRDGTSWENAINGNAMYDTGTDVVSGLQYAIYCAGLLQDDKNTSTLEKTEVTVSEGELINYNITQSINENDYFQIRAQRAVTGSSDRPNECWWYSDEETSGSSASSFANLLNEDKVKTLFKFVKVENDQNNQYKIKNYAGLWLKVQNQMNRPYQALTTTNDEADASVFTISNNTQGGFSGISFQNNGYYLYSQSHSNIAWGTGNNNATYVWQLRRASMTTTPRQYNVKAEVSVYVGAGTYKSNNTIVMADAVSLYGGFPKTGSPGDNERDISNKNIDYMTILDGQSTRRVLRQPGNFIVSTTVEGFVIKNGYSTNSNFGGGVVIRDNGIIKNCLIEKNQYVVNNSSTAFPCGGAGVYMTSGAVIMNSIIRYNKASWNVNTNSGVLIGGAGIFSEGGVVQNSLIVRNTARNVANHPSAAVLGAGLYVKNKSRFYNCTIAYNFGNVLIGSNQDFSSEDISRGENTQYNSNKAATGGVWDGGATQVYGTTYTRYSNFYNCILWGNFANGRSDENLLQVGMSGRSSTPSGGFCPDAMQNCYSSAAHVNLASDKSSENGIRLYDRVFSTTEIEIYSGVPGPAYYPTFLRICEENQPFSDDALNTDFSLASLSDDEESNSRYCINQGGHEDVLEAMGITEDIVGQNRVIDCTVDKGAYEFYDSYAITPHTIKVEGSTTVVDYEKPATFYVTPDGSGLASASDPDNAACAAKLQRVLDAAGRYKYQHPEQQVIVKVATYANGADFQYYATRTTDESDMDVRVWSIIVPRGVEVWGGYTDAENGFDNRNITENETRFDSYYKGTDQQGVNTYHVLTFTDRVFDGDGKPYRQGDALTGASTWTEGATYMSMGTRNGAPHVTDRAVVDGIFITGGQADMKVATTTTTTTTTARNINSYGGAAIVTDYAHVRNCIVRDNEGIYGGALALTHNALVTGCLIDRNEAEYGGAIYVFENGTVLSNGITVETVNDAYDATNQDDASRYDYNMPHVLSSTIVNNDASVQGGGVWFQDNVRFHGVVVWQNRCQDQANVRGQYNVTRSDDQNYFTTEYYPFNYSAIQGIRPSGINNTSVTNDNAHGVRFYSTTNGTEGGHVLAEVSGGTGLEERDRYADFGYYRPTSYSVLTHGGMPVEVYRQYVADEEIGKTDFMNKERDASVEGQRRFIEIGALAGNKSSNSKQLMLRLFVARPEDVDTDAALAMAMKAEDAEEGSYDEYYSQEGSSFAYPFTRLQDALDYIYRMRGYDITDADDTDGDGKFFREDNIKENANDMAFEIWMGPGTYIPTVDLGGNYRNSVGNTFLIPEGVTIVGGHHPSYACDVNGNIQTNSTNIKHFFGAYSEPDFKPYMDDDGNATNSWANGNYYLDSNSKKIQLNEGAPKNFYQITDGTTTYRIHQVHRYTANAKRKLDDINANSVLEPWEFMNQTILSGQIEGMENKGVHHIVTIIPNQEYQGALPLTQGQNMFNPPTNPDDYNYGYTPHEQGQIIALDGLIFTGGYAYGYQPGTVDDDHKMKYNHGGAILVDGNRYNNYYNHKRGTLNDGNSENFKETQYMHATKVGSVGYRHIPLMVSQCKFENNQAGYGGAISTNTTLDVVNCSFEHNRAMAGEDVVDITVEKTDGTTVSGDLPVKSPGAGGAIYGTYQVTGINAIFANNESTSSEIKTDTHVSEYTIMSDLVDQLKKTGSAEKAIEKATKYQLYPGSGGAVFMASHGQFHFMNCNFVRNQALAYPAIYTSNPNYQAQMEKTDGKISLKEYNQAFNTVFWGNEIHPTIVNSHQDREKKAHLTVISRVVNYGPADRGTLSSDGKSLSVSPYEVTIDDALAAQAALDRKGYTEQIWFSAYEDNRGKSPKNNLDLRDFVFDPRLHVKKHLITELGRKFEEELLKERKEEENNENYTLTDEEKQQCQAKAQGAYQNCNILLDSQNNTSEGPNFVNPSQTAGYAGYMESADWSTARLCNLTDNGWGRVTQTVTTTDNVTYKTTLLKYDNDANPPIPVPSYPNGRNLTDGTEDDYSSEVEGDWVVDGAYPAIRYMRGNEKYKQTVPIGDDEYMYISYASLAEPVAMNRISMDPNPTQNQTYIDIGVYEYRHTQLKYTSEADAVDVIWVSAREKPDNGLPDGSDWSQPTSDMQRAIETLLSSRNGNRKEIRLMDGTITPIYTIEDKLAFYIDTEKLNKSVVLSTKGEGLGVMSLTIKGGYSHDLPNVRSTELYPAIIRQQRRTDGGTSDKWDHLFYINDATQRYGVNNGAYDNTNGYGHKAGKGENTSYNSGVYTIPIEFDGVRLINDQAKKNTRGSAIHYAALTEILSTAASYGNSDSDVTSTPANVTTSYTPSTSETAKDYKHGYATVTSPAKIIISKSHIMGSGNKPENNYDATANADASAVYLGGHGHAILYNNVLHTNYGSPLDADCRAVTVNNTYARNGGPVKLNVANSTLHNSVLWQNTASENGSQFILNGINFDGTVESVIGEAFDYKSKEDYLSHNAYTGGPYTNTSYDETSEDGVKKYSYNTALTDENDDVMGGPNFRDYNNPDITQRDFSFIPSLRLLNKGENARYDTLRVDAGTYLIQNNNVNEKLFTHIINSDEQNMLYDLAINTTYYEDAASNPRFFGSSIDLGAYEYQNDLRRVFYVDPFNSNMGSGATWGDPIGEGGIQSAVNLAALYHANSKGKREQAFVFVKGAMQRDKDSHTGESITLQDGVSIYGSIDYNLTDTVVMKDIDDSVDKSVFRHSDDEIINFLLTLDEHDEGQVGPNTFRTAINGIYTNDNSRYNTTTTVDNGTATEQQERGFDIKFPIYSLISGFHVTNKNAVTAPVIDVDPKVDGTGKPKVAMRKIAVYDNNLAEGVTGVPTLASVKNALVYNSLFRDNNAREGSVLRLEEGAWALNISAQGKVESIPDNGTTYNSPYNGHGKLESDETADGKEKANRIVYSIVNYDQQDPDYTGDGKDSTVTMQTKYTMSGHNYRRTDRNMYFQLAEGSPHINEIAIDLSGGKKGNEFLPQNLQWFVDYTRDRDMMGNPRVLTLLPTSEIAKAHGKEAHATGMHLLDRGSFETWFVSDEVVRTSTGAPALSHHSPVTKHFAPHTGSVVYINEGCNLVCGTELQPGFLLLKSGASLYGDGHKVMVSYVSVEREVNPKGSVVSLPFPMDYGRPVQESDGTYVTGIARAYYKNAAGTVTDKAEKGGILHLDYDEDTEVHEYDSEERMQPDSAFIFSATDGAWRELTADKTKKLANQGVLLVPPTDVLTTFKSIYDPDDDDVMENKLIYSFTARGKEWEDMMYEEEGEKFKTVTLGQHDDAESTNQGADFTSKEDMGWNCIGIPYLVSDYHPFNGANGTFVANKYANNAGAPSSHYNMHIPHTLWLYYNGTTTADGTTAVDGDGGFYSVPSWENTTENSWHLAENDTPRLWMGEGIFVQTASVTGSEDLTFYRPVYGVTSTFASSGAVRKKGNTRYYVDEDIDEEVVRLNISVKNRTIYVRGLQGGEQLGIYDVPGRCHQLATAREGRSEWSYALSQPGIYIVTVNGVGRKVVVK